VNPKPSNKPAIDLTALQISFHHSLFSEEEGGDEEVPQSSVEDDDGLFLSCDESFRGSYNKSKLEK